MLLAGFLQIAGMVVLVLGAHMLAPWLGLMVAGFFFFFMGYVLEPRGQVNNAPQSD